MSPRSNRSNVVLPLPFGPTSPNRIPDVTANFIPSNNVRSPIGASNILQRDQLFWFGVPRVDEKSIFSADDVRVLEFRSASSPIISCAVSMRAFDFVVRAFRAAPQPFDFRVHTVLKRFLPLSLRVEIFFLRHKKRTVISAYAQKPVFIHGSKFDHGPVSIHFQENSGRGFRPPPPSNDAFCSNPSRAS